MRDMRFGRLLIVLLLVAGILLGRALLRKKPQVVNSPADYTEKIENFDGTPTH